MGYLHAPTGCVNTNCSYVNNNNNGGNPQPDKTKGIRFGMQPNNGNTPNQRTKHNNTTKKPNKPKKFADHNQGELKGILILEDATIRSYNTLKERLETLVGSGQYNSQMGTSIEKPKAQEYTMCITAKEGNEVDKEDTNEKTALMDMYQEEAKPGSINTDWILLDSESSIKLLVNRQMIKDIHEALNGQHMNIHCNSGEARTNLMGTLPGFGPVWFYPKGIANVLSLALLVSDRFRVTMDTDVENAIFAHKDDCARKFIRSPWNLYYCNMKDINTNILTIKTAREIQEILGFPTTEELVQMIQKNLIKNCDLTSRDISLMTKVYSKHKGILKGKSVHKQPPHIMEDINPVPKDILSPYKHVTLWADIINVNGLNFLSRGFKVTQLHADNQFECLKDNLLGKGNLYEPTIERSNRTVKENLRSVFNNLPVAKLPKRCIIEIVYSATFWLNCRITSVCGMTPIRELMTGILSYNTYKHTMRTQTTPSARLDDSPSFPSPQLKPNHK
eukprot:jgi/Psemu1/45365/gm1.45365_g